MIFKASILFLLGVSSLSASEVLMQGGAKLSGKVTGLTEDGHLLLESPLGVTPLDLRADRVHRIEFSHPAEAAPDRHDAVITLTNGNEFPCDLKDIDALNVTAETSFAGLLTVPRSSISTLQFGMRPQATIFEGPESAEGWDLKSGWRFTPDCFSTDSSGTLARTFELPENYSISFDLSWEAVPNLQIGLNDDSAEINARGDRYIATINASGIDLKREQKEGNRRFLPMALIAHDMGPNPEEPVTIELRVDRKLAIVSLFIDGVAEGRWADPTGKSPAGNGFYYRSSIAGSDSLTLEHIHISEWDPAADRHRSEERGDPARDSIILRDGDRGIASVLGYRADGDGGILTYKLDHRDAPLQTPAQEISTVFFAETGEESDAGPEPVWSLDLEGRGNLTVLSLKTEAETLQITHPLLGNLNLRPTAVTRIDRLGAGGHEPTSEEEPDAVESTDDE